MCVVLAPSLEQSSFWCLDLYGKHQLANIDIGPAKPKRTVLVCSCVLLSLQLCETVLVDLDQQERLACRHFKGLQVCRFAIRMVFWCVGVLVFGLHVCVHMNHCWNLQLSLWVGWLVAPG